MLAKKIIALLTVVVLFVSCLFLCNLVLFNREYLHKTSFPRLITLLAIHLVLATYTFILARVQQLEEAARWGFYLSANVTALITMTELYIFRQRKQYTSSDVTDFSEPPELIFVNLYFLLYMFFLLSSFVLGVILVTLCCIEWARQKRITLSLERNVKEIEFAQSMSGEDCPICLSAFNQKDTICQIRCHHRFHDHCLKEWIRVNYTCPNCRLNLFSQINQELRE